MKLMKLIPFFFLSVWLVAIDGWNASVASSMSMCDAERSPYSLNMGTEMFVIGAPPNR